MHQAQSQCSIGAGTGLNVLVAFLGCFAAIWVDGDDFRPIRFAGVNHQAPEVRIGLNGV